MVWHPNEEFWWGYKKKSSRHWNIFGLTEPSGESKTHNIVCEINIPLSRGTWRIAGAFAKDESGEIYIVHTGKIGGGRKGIGQKHFIENFPDPESYVSVMRNGKSKDVAMVSALNDKNLIKNLADFVRKVDKIKRRQPDCLTAANDSEIEKCQKTMSDALKAAGEAKQVMVRNRRTFKKNVH